MKKNLALLLILIIAEGVFAQQGNWSLRGKAAIGTLLNFQDDPVTVKGKAYDDPINGELNVGYTLKALRLGVSFKNNTSDSIGAWFYYDAGNYVFTAETSLTSLINNIPNVSRLWGYYKMLKNIITLEAAYNSRDAEFWVSDKYGAFGYPIGGPWPGGDTFTKQDHGNYLVTDVKLSKLNFGVKLPNIFSDNAVEFTNDVVKKAIVGLKVNIQPIEAAAQFRLNDYGVYFGGKWFKGPVIIGSSFMGILDPDAPSKLMKFGGGVEYYPGPYGAWFKGYCGIHKTDADNRRNQIGIEPGFFYNVIPSHMRFQTDFGFYFLNIKNGGTKEGIEVSWAAKPQLFWNFLGTGAGGCETGIIVRYILVAGDSIVIGNSNALDFTFRFSF